MAPSANQVVKMFYVHCFLILRSIFLGSNILALELYISDPITSSVFGKSFVKLLQYVLLLFKVRLIYDLLASFQCSLAFLV